MGALEKKVFWLLAITLIFAAGLRIANITKKGLWVYDEAYYSLEAKTLYSACSWVIDNRAQIFSGTASFGSLKTYLRETGCIFPTGVAKPFFMVSASVAALLTGAHDYSIALMSGFWGLGIIVAAFLLVKKIDGDKSAFLALLLAFFSVDGLIFSRMGQSQTMTAFLLLCAIYLAVSDKFFLSGIVLSLGFASHYCVLFNAVFFFLWFAIFKRKYLLSFLAGFILPLFLFDGISWMEKFILRDSLADINFYTYGQYLIRQFFNASTQTRGSFFDRDFLFVFKLLINREGIILSAASLAYLGLPLWKREKFTPGQWCLWFNGWGVLLLWVLNTGLVFSRAIFPAWTVVLAGTAIALSRIRIRYVKEALLIAAAVFFITRFYQVVNISSGYRDAALWLKNHGQDSVVAIHNWPLYQFYLDNKIYPNVDRVNNAADMANFHGKGIRYLAVDPTAIYLGDKNWAFLKSIINQYEPAARIPNKFIEASWLNYPPEDNGLFPAKKGEGYIYIYDLCPLEVVGRDPRIAPS